MERKKVFLVSYTDKETNKTFINLHIGCAPIFKKEGLQMVTEAFEVNNVYIRV